MFYKIFNLLALIAAVAWVATDYSWESLVTFITSLSTFIFLIFKKDVANENSADKKLFKKFNNDLTPYSISFIEQNSLKSPFLNSKLEPFFNFESLWKDVHHTFTSKKLNKKKSILLKSISNFNKLVSENTFPTNNPRANCIPKEWELNNPQRYNNACRIINDAQDDLVGKYNDFVKTAKKLLRV